MCCIVPTSCGVLGRNLFPFYRQVSGSHNPIRILILVCRSSWFLLAVDQQLGDTWSSILLFKSFLEKDIRCLEWQFLDIVNFTDQFDG
jgi:hypothetical protein